jgi:hypothetical protein
MSSIGHAHRRGARLVRLGDQVAPADLDRIDAELPRGDVERVSRDQRFHRPGPR